MATLFGKISLAMLASSSQVGALRRGFIDRGRMLMDAKIEEEVGAFGHETLISIANEKKLHHATIFVSQALGTDPDK